MITDKGTIVITFDDVIAYNTYDLYLYLLNHYRYYGKYLNLLKLYTKKELYLRQNASLLDYLANTKFFHYLTPERQFAALNNMLIVLYSNYYHIQKSYSSNMITKIAKYGINNPMFKNNIGIKEINIVIKYKTQEEKQRKTEFVRNVFGKLIKIIYVNSNEEYYDKIKNLAWSVLITDDVNTVERLSSGNIDHKEFLLPRYGYNIAKPELIELIKQKSGSISYYEIED